jgi:hypothetical protein
VIGCARAFEQPAGQALLPRLVPTELLSRAIATSSSTTQLSMIAGPALGGLIYLGGPGSVYTCSAILFLLGSVLMVWVREQRTPAPPAPFSLTYLFAGLRFIRSNPVLLGAISLDMVAVLLGGATALLPIYARDILHTGPEGLGLLRSAPAGRRDRQRPLAFPEPTAGASRQKDADGRCLLRCSHAGLRRVHLHPAVRAGPWRSPVPPTCSAWSSANRWSSWKRLTTCVVGSAR